MKRFKQIFLIIIFLLLLASIMTACNNNVEEGYIEVTDIRVPMSTVYLSPDGNTSTFQLTPTIIPWNATNQKLIYYVAPNDLQYFDVSVDGLITAKKITEDIDSVPIRIYSTTNPNASVLVSVVIERVEVKRIEFKQSEMKVRYDSDPVQLELIFEPYHAQEGRNVTFISLNNEVATVDSTGLMTLRKVGKVTIIARGSTMGGRQVEGRVSVTVAYASGRYNLEATSQSPQYEQVIGDPQPITFEISRDLYDNIDLNPDIKWFVAGVRVISQNGKWSFEYKPEDDSTPSPPYTIKAVIQPKGEPPIELESHPITLYKKFSGFTLVRNEPQGEKYYFGEQISFAPMMSAEIFDWYIKNKGEIGLGDYLGTSIFNQSNGRFEFAADRAGEFVLTAQGKQGNVVIETKSFEFNVIRYVEGDRLQIIPQTKREEKVPDSYDWYLHEYDIATGTLTAGVLIGSSNGNQAFNYEATAQGWYVLSSTPTLNGVHVYTDVGGVPTKMQEYTQPFRVWKQEERTDVEYLIVDGAKVDNEYRPVIKWSSTGGVNSFIVEVFSNNKIYLIDTTDNNANNGVICRDYSVILPLNMATLTQDFSVRVKQKGGIFSDPIQYTANSIAQKYYGCLNEINYGINGYIRDMKEMGELINYISVFRPQRLLLNSENGAKSYKVTVATKLMYRSVGISRYPVFTESPYKSDNLTNMYNLVNGAINAYFIRHIMRVDITYDELGDTYDLIITIADGSDEFIYQRGDGINNFDFDLNYATVNRGENFDDLAVYSKATIEVSTSNELYYAVTTGRRPLPVANTVAKEIFDEAKNILNRILSFNMNTFEKVLAIHDFLASEVENDKVLKDYSRLEPKPHNLYLYDGYHLEGVFLHRKAVSLGKSKAFNFLCWMEGIPSSLVNGIRGTENHSWNKVRIGDNWYNVDVTSARAQREQGTAINYSKFLISDQDITLAGYIAYGDHYVAQTNFDTTGRIAGSVNISETIELDLALLDYSTKIQKSIYAFGINFTDEFESPSDLRDIIYERLEEILGESLISFEELIQSSGKYYILLLSKPS